MIRNNISDKLKAHTLKMTEWEKSFEEVERNLNNLLLLEPKIYDWFDQYESAKHRQEQIIRLRPDSSERNLMSKLAKFLYDETISRTSECMMTFNLDEIDAFLNVLIDFDKFTVDYVFQLVHEIGKTNVLQTDFSNDQFDITVGLEIVAIHHLKQASDEYVSTIINFLEKKYDFEKSELLLEWNELDAIFSDLEIYSDSEEDPKEYEKCVDFWINSDFTKALIKILESSYAYSEVQENGLMVDLSEYYA